MEVLFSRELPGGGEFAGRPLNLLSDVPADRFDAVDDGTNPGKSQCPTATILTRSSVIE